MLPATTSSATTNSRLPTSSPRPRKIAANTTVQRTPVPTIGATTLTRPRSSASKSVACASAVTTPELAYGPNAARSRGRGDRRRSRFASRTSEAPSNRRGLRERVGRDVLRHGARHVVAQTERHCDAYGQSGPVRAVVDRPLALRGQCDPAGGGEIDLLFCHDPRTLEQGTQARGPFAALAAKLRPALVIYGHQHRPHVSAAGQPALVGLGSFRDGQSSAVVLDSDETGRLVRTLRRDGRNSAPPFRRATRGELAQPLRA